MATNRRTYANDYFAWYNNDKELAIVWHSLTTDDSAGVTAGELDSYSDSDVSNGLRITYHGYYQPCTTDLQFRMQNTGLDSGLMPSLVCYIKARLYEDLGDFQKAAYFRQMFHRIISQHPLRKSGVRTLSVPRL